MTGRRIVLDGYNLMFRDTSPEDAPLAAARESFLRRVDAARGAREDVTVVFDGRAGAGADEGPLPRGLRVVWARAPRSADDMIVKLVAGSPRGQTEVLTHDRELRHRVRGAGGRIGDPEAFFQRATPRPRRSGRPAGKPPPPRGAELDAWQRLFGEEPPDPGSRGGDPR